MKHEIPSSVCTKLFWFFVLVIVTYLSPVYCQGSQVDPANPSMDVYQWKIQEYRSCSVQNAVIPAGQKICIKGESSHLKYPGYPWVFWLQMI